MADRQLPTIRASVLGPLVRRLDQTGRKADVLLAQHGLLRAQLADPYAPIPLKRYVAIFEDAAAALGDPLIGLRLGAACTPADLGPAGILFSASGTIRLAFERLGQHIAAVQGATSIEVVAEDADTLVCNYSLGDGGIWPRVQDSEFTLSASCHLVRRCFRAGWNPLEIHCEHDSSAHADEFYQLFHAPVRFRQSRNRIVMRRHEAERLFREEDRDLIAILNRHSRNQFSQMASDPGGLRPQVLRIIGLHLGHNPVTVPSVARELQLSPRTLQRRLAEEGTSLRDLVRDYRKQLAERHLKNAHAPIAPLADLLGYADSTSFGRAYRGWKGRSPKGSGRG